RRVQVYTTIADSNSPFFAAVKDFDLSALDPNIGTIAFVRNFDCSGTATAVDFTKAAPDVMKSAMQTCFAMEEEARARDGIKGRRCEQGDMENELNNTAKQGGGGTNFGRYGGELTLTTGGSLATASSPSKMFIKVVDATASKYCFPIDQDCQEFTVASNAATGLSISLGGGNTLTAVGFNAVDPATTATLTISTAQGTSGTANYTISRPSFTGGGTPPAAQLPAPCQQRGFNEADCRAYCGQPNSGC
ncbi:MAG: hypothetical protein Q7S98_03215, partial [Deltaproteobacteria bacterium]|nr:hypothetical protein [Deltaproteobacteria bacterium]